MCIRDSAYADECSLGHQYKPDELIDPISILSGNKPDYVSVDNWFFDLPYFNARLNKLLNEWENNTTIRKSLTTVVREFLRKPTLYIKNELLDELGMLEDMPSYSLQRDDNKTSSALRCV